MKKAVLTQTYNLQPVQSIDNRYPTKHYEMRQPTVCAVVGTRGGGKSHAMSRLLLEAKKNNTFDEVFLISPTAQSNAQYWRGLIDPEFMFEADRDAIDKVVAAAEAIKDEYEKFLKDREDYKEFNKKLNSKKGFSAEDAEYFEALGLFDHPEPPVYRYKKVQAPRFALILDDCLSSEAMLKSTNKNNINSIATTNRHLCPLKEPEGNRSACGIAVFMLIQSYKSMGNISRQTREQVTDLFLFQNKQQQQMKSIKEEILSNLNEEQFDMAYNYSTSKPYGFLWISFNPSCPTLTYRSGLTELLIFQDQMEKCVCDKSTKTKMKRKLIDVPKSETITENEDS